MKDEFVISRLWKSFKTLPIKSDPILSEVEGEGRRGTNIPSVTLRGPCQSQRHLSPVDLISPLSFRRGAVGEVSQISTRACILW
jgi:hypothetical protein